MTGHRNPAAGRTLALLAACVLALSASACSVLGGSKDAATIYAPDPRVPADPAWPRVDRQLEIASPQAPRTLDSLRIAVRPAPGEVQVYKGARWATRPAEQLQAALLSTLEDADRLRAVARPGSGIAADYRLALELRRYEADYAGRAVPDAVIEVNAKLLSLRDQRVLASRTFLQATPAAATDVSHVADAFSASLTQVTRDVAGWVLGAAAQDGGTPAAGR
ncbi:MAG TPA: ABC-type transport auxiliary lipoprotein family protein [Xanthomonadaceae bacterium]|nr:ABC-type transport auxiliary lipoprotein family protein [Xanthomonadaceae bacterium]